MGFQEFSPFVSSNIQSLRYDDQAQVLQVVFNNGAVYEYYDLPRHVAEAFEAAESKGRFFAASIKGHFRYSRV